MFRKPLAFAVCSALSIPVVGGCNDHPLKKVVYDRTVVDAVTVDINPLRAVDILFVIDNSGSMSAEQATLAANFEEFIKVLEQPDVAADYRIAVTTTDTGGGSCSGTGPENGNFVASSCRSRLNEFQTLPGFPEPEDAREVACESLCPESLSELRPTPIALSVGGEEAFRPWLESIGGRSNLPEGVDTAQAFACMGPQGINGCGFEAPLRAMERALTRANVETEDEYGFLRNDAILLVVIVTDEADCSQRPGVPDSVFRPEDGSTARSNVCWNAGVRCEEDADGELDCVSANVNAQGDASGAEDAVLTPVEDYVELLQQIERLKREESGIDGLDVMVSVIAGVPTNFPTAELQYSTGSPFSEEFGIDPGCSSENGEAVPPVRLLEFAEAFAIEDEDGDMTVSNVSSVCDSDYTEALREAANELIKRFDPACSDTCLADDDPATVGHQHDCVFSLELPDGTERPLARCVRDEAGEWALPAEEDSCVYVAVDTERDPACQKQGAPAQFVPLYRAGVPRVPGATVQATCSVSDDEASDCPWI